MSKKQHDQGSAMEPKLVRGQVWYIEYHEVSKDGKPKRVRKTFDLNRISDLSQRQQKADEILARLAKRDLDLLYDAIEFALSFKLQSDREHTRITYTSMAGIFLTWAKEAKLGTLPVAQFTRDHAQAFLDYGLRERKIGNCTYNNYIINLRSLFYELVRRGRLKDNPFSNMKKRKEEKKLRQPFSEEDRQAVAQFIYNRHRQLYLCILLICYCGIRISELRRLRIRDIDLKRGMISMGGDQTKNKERAFLTIAKKIIPVLKLYELEKYPGFYFLIGAGKGLEPSPDASCGRNTITDRHREILVLMEERGLIKSRKGLSTYSWKDTGGIALVKAGVNIMAIKSHFRHKSLSTTQRYLESLGVVNEDIRDLEADLLGLPDLSGGGKDGGAASSM